MKKYKYSILGLMVLVLVWMFVTGRQPEAKEENLSVDELIRLTNEYRVSQGLNVLEKDLELCEVAEIRAREIVDTWSHERPDGTKFYNILLGMKYEMVAAGENIGRYQNSEEEVLDMWKQSETHNENMLGDYTHIGVAIYKEDGKYHFVQIFTRRD